METTIKRELQRIFEFSVKHDKSVSSWANQDTRKFIKWAWYYKRLFVIHDKTFDEHKRISGIAVAWRTREPLLEEDPYTIENTEVGDWLYVPKVIIHPEYRSQGVMFGLLSLALWRYQGIKHVWWTQECNNMVKRYTIELPKLLRLIKHESKIFECASSS